MNSKLGSWIMVAVGFLMFAGGIFSNMVPWVSSSTQIIFVGLGVLFLALGVMNLRKVSSK